MTKVSSDELLRRFDAAGGRVYHYKGEKRCYASTIQSGSWRFGRHTCTSRILVTDNFRIEHVTKTALSEAERALVARARALPRVIPRMVGLSDFLVAINAHTLSREELSQHVGAWFFMLEVWCKTDEAREAFDYECGKSLDEALQRFAPQFAEVTR